MKPRLLIAYCLTALSLHAGDRFHFKNIDENSLGLWEANRPIFVYNNGVISKPGVPADRARSSYIHPLYGLNGEILTDDFPRDHYHHRGLFWAWPHVRIGDHEYDLWMLKGIRHEFVGWLARDDGHLDSAVLGVENVWLVGEKKVVSEQVWIRVLRETTEGRAIDVELVWKPVDKPVTLRGAEGKSYGGLTLRFAPHKGETIITTPEGVTSKDLPITHLPWADLTSQFTNAPGKSGAAIFIDPSHPDFPPEWLTRHYGVLCVGWPGVKEQTLPVGKTVRCRYRLLIHRDVLTSTKLQQIYDSYSHASPGNPLRN